MHEIKGNLITLAKEGSFDIIAHGCNCFNTFGHGIAKEVKERLPEAYAVDCKTKKGDFTKLGNYTGCIYKDFTILNCYTQFSYSGSVPSLDYEALTLVMRKINHNFPAKSIGLPTIGCGLAGGDWAIVQKIIEKELKDMVVTIVKLEE
jgi:O-acetyl-ADP-ribose deacetylase (regulator of RNase III)